MRFPLLLLVVTLALANGQELYEVANLDLEDSCTVHFKSDTSSELRRITCGDTEWDFGRSITLTDVGFCSPSQCYFGVGAYTYYKCSSDAAEWTRAGSFALIDFSFLAISNGELRDLCTNDVLPFEADTIQSYTKVECESEAGDDTVYLIAVKHKRPDAVTIGKVIFGITTEHLRETVEFTGVNNGWSLSCDCETIQAGKTALSYATGERVGAVASSSLMHHGNSFRWTVDSNRIFLTQKRSSRPYEPVIFEVPGIFRRFKIMYSRPLRYHVDASSFEMQVIFARRDGLSKPYYAFEISLLLTEQLLEEGDTYVVEYDLSYGDADGDGDDDGDDDGDGDGDGDGIVEESGDAIRVSSASIVAPLCWRVLVVLFVVADLEW